MFDQKHLVTEHIAIQTKDYDPSMSSVWSASMSNVIDDSACNKSLSAYKLTVQDCLAGGHWVNSSDCLKKIEFLLQVIHAAGGET